MSEDEGCGATGWCWPRGMVCGEGGGLCPRCERDASMRAEGERAATKRILRYLKSVGKEGYVPGIIAAIERGEHNE